MANSEKKKGGNKKKNNGVNKKRLGSVIQIRKTSGLGQLNKPSSVVGSYGPALIGGIATAATTIGLRMMTPRTKMQMYIMEWAPLYGGAVGGLAALIVGSISGAPAGYGVAAGSTAVSLAMTASESIAKARMAANANGAAPQTIPNGGNGNGATAGLFGRHMGAIVPEYSNTRGLGAIVMEPQASRGYGAGPLGAYGDQVNLAGSIGNVNQAAFGTPGFSVRGR